MEVRDKNLVIKRECFEELLVVGCWCFILTEIFYGFSFISVILTERIYSLSNLPYIQRYLR